MREDKVQIYHWGSQRPRSSVLGPQIQLHLVSWLWARLGGRLSYWTMGESAGPSPDVEAKSSHFASSLLATLPHAQRLVCRSREAKQLKAQHETWSSSLLWQSPTASIANVSSPVEYPLWQGSHSLQKQPFSLLNGSESHIHFPYLEMSPTPL